MTVSSTGLTQVLRGTANTALVPTKWLKQYLTDSYAKDPLKNFYGMDNVVVVKSDLQAEAGDKITIPMIGLLNGAGVTNDGDYDGNIDKHTLYSMDVQIHEHGYAVGISGKMTEKSSILNLSSLNMMALSKWRAAFNARAVIDALSGLKLHKLGYQAQGASGLAKEGSTQIDCVNQVAPAYVSGDTAKRYYCGGQKSTDVYTGRVADITSLSTAANYVMGPEVIEDLVRMAQKTHETDGTLVDPLEPLSINGKELYLLLVTPEQAKNIKQSTKWKNGHYYADIRGLENSLFSGQIGVWNKTMVIETDLLHKRTGGAAQSTGPEYFDNASYCAASGVSVHRALFLGRNACAWAWGSKPQYEKFYADHAKTKEAERITQIYGLSKVAKYASTTSTATLQSDTEKGCIIVDTCIA